MKIQDCPDFFFWKINAIFLSHPLFGNHLSLNPQTGPRPEFCYRRFIFRATKGDQTLLFSWRNKLVCVCRTSAASVELLPRGLRAVAFPRWLHVQSCSTWLILMVRCCFGGLCVRDRLAASVCVCCTSAASVELLPRGWCAVPPSLSLGYMSSAARRGSLFVVASATCVLASFVQIHILGYPTYIYYGARGVA